MDDKCSKCGGPIVRVCAECDDPEVQCTCGDQEEEGPAIRLEVHTLDDVFGAEE